MKFNKSNIESKYTGDDKKSLNITHFETIIIPKLSLYNIDEK